jgi:Flp pilus assembly protein TadD
MPRKPRPTTPTHVASSGGWQAALIAIVVALTYANSLQNPFVLDDHEAIVQNDQIRDLSRLGDVLLPQNASPIAGRPLVGLSMAFNYALGGLDVFGYHLVSIAMHVACALLAFGLIRRTLELPRLKPHAGGQSTPLAFAAALLWAVHPLNSEVVDYLSQRTESMMAVFYLSTLYAACRAAAATRSGKWEIVAVASCALGMLCKESMATAPVMVALYDRVFIYTSWRDAMRRRARLYLGLAATWLVVVGLVVTSPRLADAGFSSGVAPWTYLLNQARMIATYLRLSVWPNALVVYYGWPEPLTLADVLVPAAMVLALCGATLAGLARAPAIGFLGAWFFVTLAPTSSVIPIATEVGAERRMYLPLLAVVMLFVLGAHAARKRWGDGRAPRVAPVLALICVSGALATATFVRNREYASPLALAQTIVDRRPTPVAYHILGEQLMIEGRDAEAIGPLSEAVDRGNSRAGYALGAALFNELRLDEAIARLTAFVATSELPYRLAPSWLEPPQADVASARILMARAFLAKRLWSSATEQLERVLKMRPSHAEAQRLLADARFGEQRWQEASALYSEYLNARPDDGQALVNFGIARVAVGDLDRAVASFRRAVDLDPTNGRARDLLGLALKDQEAASAER